MTSNLIKQNNRIISGLLFIILITTACSGKKSSSLEDKKPQWVSIFNGDNLEGWKVKMRGFSLDENFKNTFRAEDGMLRVSYDNYENFNEEYGHIFYDEELSHYKIRFEYRFIGDQVPNGPGWAFRNSGIMLHGQHPETMDLNQSFPVSIEAQMLGGNGTDERPTANVCSPGTNYEMNSELITTHCTNSSSKTYHGDQWVKMEVDVYGDSLIQHYVNDELVFTFSKPQLDPRDSDAKKLIDAGSPIALTSGYISFQAESHPCDIKNIELMKLD